MVTFHNLTNKNCHSENTLLDQAHFSWRSFLPQPKTVAAFGTSDSGVLWGDPAFTPRHSFHFPLLLLVYEGTFPYLTQRCCEETESKDVCHVKEMKKKKKTEKKKIIVLYTFRERVRERDFVCVCVL